MKLPSRIILLIFALTLLAFANGMTFSAWLSGREAIAWHLALPLAAMAWIFIFLALIVSHAKWDAKWDK